MTGRERARAQRVGLYYRLAFVQADARCGGYRGQRRESWRERVSDGLFGEYFRRYGALKTVPDLNLQTLARRDQLEGVYSPRSAVPGRAPVQSESARCAALLGCAQDDDATIRRRTCVDMGNCVEKSW